MSIVSIAFRVATALVFSATSVLATENQPVAWDDLIDQSAQTFEDPYRDLTYDQIENLREIIIETARIAEGGLGHADKALSEDRISGAKELLADDGIDADWLIDQRWVVADRREKAATAANPDLDGQTVTLAGFAILAPADADGTTVVYLVPERGMCSHTPPPNANQMIRARVKGDWNPTSMHQPVRLTGKLSVKETRHSFRIVDGEVPMRASYVLDATEVETAPSFGSPPKATNGWAASIAEKLRASGQLPGQLGAATE